MMKMRKLIASLASLLMLVSLLVPQQPVFAAESGIEVQFNNGDTQANSNTINAKFKVVNTGSSSVSLSQLKLRYYYTKDANTSQNFYCDYSGMMSGGAHSNMTNKITGTIVDMSKSVATADTYIEVGFTSDAGGLAAGGSIEIQTRVARSDWSNYNQSNDFSYKMAGPYEVWDRVAAYLNGTLVFGKSPTDEPSTKDPEISPKSATFNKSAPRNITVALTPNGNTFNGVNGLTRNTHYTVSGNTVTLLSSYLSTLSLGSKKLTFDFGVDNNPQLSLTVEDSTPSGDELEVTVGTVTGNTNDTVTVPINFKNVSKVGNVITCNFYLTYDSSLLEPVSVSAGDIVKNPSVNFASQINKSTSSISFLFLDDTLGDQLITEDGVFVNISFKVLGEAGQTAKLQFTEEGAFGDGNISRINAVNKVDGAVIIASVEEPTISPEAVIFDKFTPSDITVTLTPNGSTFSGITGLRANTDYTISNNTVTISKSYLSTLPIGLKGLTFDFGVSNNPVLSVTIEDSTPITEDGLSIALGTVSGNTGDTITVPVLVDNISKVGSIITCNFYISFDDSLLEAVSVKAGDIIVNAPINFASKINQGSISCLFLAL